jgi:hypothetical protein
MTGITDGALHEIILEMHSFTTEPNSGSSHDVGSAGEAPGGAVPAEATRPFVVVTRGMAFEFHDGAEPSPATA